jgi:hypothetical protein
VAGGGGEGVPKDVEIKASFVKAISCHPINTGKMMV